MPALHWYSHSPWRCPPPGRVTTARRGHPPAPQWWWEKAAGSAAAAAPGRCHRQDQVRRMGPHECQVQGFGGPHFAGRPAMLTRRRARQEAIAYVIVHRHHVTTSAQGSGCVCDPMRQFQVALVTSTEVPSGATSHKASPPPALRRRWPIGTAPPAAARSAPVVRQWLGVCTASGLHRRAGRVMPQGGTARRLPAATPTGSTQALVPGGGAAPASS